mgnify:FL=1
MKKKIIFLVQLPNPVHGVSLINQSIQKSKEIKKMFNTHFIDISTAKKINKIDLFEFRKIFTSMSIYYKFLKSLIIFKPDKIYISLSILGWGFIKDSILVIISKLFNNKIIFHLHRKGLNKLINRSLFLKSYYKFIFKNADVIHLSKSLFQDIRKIKDTNTSSYVVNNGIDDQNFKKIKKNKIFTFIFISNLFRSKGIDILLNAILLLNKNNLSKKFQVKIIGNTTINFKKNDLNNFLNLNKTYDNVQFLGAKYGIEKFIHISNSHIMVHPTKDDCFPLCLLEAMSFGLPIISSREGAIPEIVSNKYNGIIIKKLNPLTVANAMKFYLKDRKTLNLHSKNNKKDFKIKYTMNSFQNTLINTLTKSLNSN